MHFNDDRNVKYIFNLFYNIYRKIKNINLYNLLMSNKSI